jgi:AraC-like DNA-binding protein
MDYKNLLESSDVELEVFPPNCNGMASRDPAIIFETLPDLENESLDYYSSSYTYDTYQALGNKQPDNCYTFTWKNPIVLNQFVMTMGFPYTDGGWWTELVLEYRKGEDDSWKKIKSCQFQPLFSFMDTSYGRFPFEKYHINFPPLKVTSIRLIGTGGGYSSFTSLARCEAYHIEEQEEENIRIRNYPLPRLYKLISPDKIWELGTYLFKATGLNLITTHLEYYLNAESHREFLNIYEPQYKSPPLWRLLNDKDHWEHWSADNKNKDISMNHYFEESFARILGPIMINGESLGTVMTYPPVVLQNTDMERHKKNADNFDIDWNLYQIEMSKMITMSAEKIEGIAGLISFMINEILDQIHQTQIFINRNSNLNKNDNIVEEALEIMENELENGIYIDQILERLHISYHSLSTAFKKTHDMTPNKVIHELKMERGRKYLIDPRLRIIDIAGTLGYTENHFIRSFKKKYGKTPGEYKKDLNSEK